MADASAHGPVKVSCPSCGVEFTVPTEVLGIDHLRHKVLVRMDRSGLYGHLQSCAGTTDRPLDAPLEHHPAELVEAVKPDPELAGRIHMMLAGGHFMSKGGSGACTMCGVNRDVCLANLQRPGEQAACCPACGGGNTHPAPQENAQTCAQWAETHGARD